MKKALFSLPLMLTIILSVVAQGTVVLTVSVPQWMVDIYDQSYFDEFHAEHPGVEVMIVSDVNAFPPISPIWTSTDEYFTGMEAFVSRADLIYISASSLTPVNVRGGYWLNLAPLVGSDSEIDESTYYSAALEAFTLDGGLWGLPTTIEPQIMGYLPDAFDDQGLTYPSGSWTMEQFVQAARALTEYDDDGNPTKIGFFGDIRLVFRSLLDQNLYDQSTGISVPQLNNIELAGMLDSWIPIRAEITPVGDYSSAGVGLQIIGPYAFIETLREDGNAPLTPSALPNGYIGVKVNGFAVSAGTTSPELAYELAKYFSLHPRHMRFAGDELSANRSLVATNPDGDVDTQEFAPEIQVFIEQSSQNMLSDANLRYFEYVLGAMTLMQVEGMDAQSALQQMQVEAVTNLEAAETQRRAQTLFVATPQPTADNTLGEIVLNFGISGPIPDLQRWERIAADFAANDTTVGQVNLQQDINDHEQFMENNECFFLSYNAVDPFRNEMWLPLDPLMGADPSFEEADFVPGVLQQFRLNGHAYGYPLTLQPVVVQYDTVRLQSLDTLPTQGGWTVDEFLNTLNLVAASDAPGVPFSIRTTQNTDLLMLMATLGGLPVDYRTDPPTYNFTDSATVDTIQQVLDLAKEGMFNYSRLGTFTFTSAQATGSIQVLVFNGYDHRLNESFDIAMYPQGTQYPVIGFGDLGGGYIRLDSANPEACYRWFGIISLHPELFGLQMPARLSAINNPAMVATHSVELLDVYNEILELIKEPNAVVFSSAGRSGGSTLENFVVNQWLNRAFDAYVLEDADLEEELVQAQRLVDAYLLCVARVGEVPPQESEVLPARECVAQVDPELDADWDAAAAGA